MYICNQTMVTFLDGDFKLPNPKSQIDTISLSSEQISEAFTCIPPFFLLMQKVISFLNLNNSNRLQYMDYSTEGTAVVLKESFTNQ